MAEIVPNWSLAAEEPCPQVWVEAVQRALGQALPEAPARAAQLIWQRQLCPLELLPGFLHPSAYRPTPASAFGADMDRALERLLQAHRSGEKVAIWGDFDADGVTATAVLWDGLGALFPKHEQLTYYIPNRIRESHGLSKTGLDQLHRWGARILVTCDTGSTNGPEIEYANRLGMAVIVTDHHTLPDQRPDLVALINPRSLPVDHPLATLSGVAVAYKLIEGLYAALAMPSGQANQDLDSLLDLVAIGLIADLVELRGDCRYLAQVGLRRLQTHLQGSAPPSRPGVAALLTLCKRTGDRPTDISFGIGPRINAVSRIHGDASFCVELLTSRDTEHCRTLAHEAELANTRRKALQQDVYRQVMEQVNQTDLATTQCLVLASEQWPAGILGLVAGQISQHLGRPTVLLRTDSPDGEGGIRMARGSARSVQGLDLYELFKAHSDLLHGFGGHPLAAGLTLPAGNVPMLRSALNRSVREARGESGTSAPPLTIDLVVTVTELGKSLFRQLKLLEPYGMGNPVPRLLIRNAWFERGFHRNLRDRTGRTVKFIKTEFELWDDTARVGFPGEWWGHYKDELPQGRCDVVVEIDHNAHQGYHVKLVAARPVAVMSSSAAEPMASPILDWRQQEGPQQPGSEVMQVNQIPLSWEDWKQWHRQAHRCGAPLALSYAPATAAEDAPSQVWQQLVGMAKYLARTQQDVTSTQLQERLGLTSTSLKAGLGALQEVGFDWETQPDAPDRLRRWSNQPTPSADRAAIQRFLDVVQEERFRRRYFAQVRVPTLAAKLQQRR